MKRDISYMKRDILYMKRDILYMKRDILYMKRDILYTKRDIQRHIIHEKRHIIHEKRHIIHEKRHKIHEKRHTIYEKRCFTWYCGVSKRALRIYEKRHHTFIRAIHTCVCVCVCVYRVKFNGQRNVYEKRPTIHQKRLVKKRKMTVYIHMRHTYIRVKCNGQETYKRDLQKRPIKETYKRDLHKRPTKETYHAWKMTEYIHVRLTHARVK